MRLIRTVCKALGKQGDEKAGAFGLYAFMAWYKYVTFLYLIQLPKNKKKKKDNNHNTRFSMAAAVRY